jgi:predicted DNA-binding transcriptional regulator AlpA
MLPPFVTKKQVADALGVTPRCVDLWVKRGLLPRPIKIGGMRQQNRVRWQQCDVVAAIERLGAPVATQQPSVEGLR